MSFYHNCDFRRKHKTNKSKNNFHEQSPVARSANIKDLDQAYKRTISLISHELEGANSEALISTGEGLH